MNPDEFAAKIKAKYPQYASVDNLQLSRMVVDKHPEYQSVVNFSFVDNAGDKRLFRGALDKVETKAQETYGKDSVTYKLGTLPARAVSRATAATADFLSGTTQKFGKTVGESLAAPKNAQLYEKAVQDHNEGGFLLQQAITKKKALGQDTTRLEQALALHRTEAPKEEDFLGKDTTRRVNETLGKNVQEVGGQALGTVVEALSGGVLKGLRGVGFIKNAGKTAEEVSKANKAFKALPFGEKAKVIGKEALEATKEVLPLGYASDVSRGLQRERGENRTGGKAFIPGAGTALSVTVPGGIATTRLGINAVETQIPKFQVRAINDLENTYSDLMSGTTPGKKKVDKLGQKTEILNKSGTTGRTPQRTLAEDGIIPNRSGPKLDTFEQAQQYREKVKPLREANRAALKETGLATEPVKLDDLETKAIEYARTPENINAGRFDKMEQEIRAEFNLLRKNYPKGEIPLDVVDDIKSARWDNVFKNKGLVEADILKKSSEYSIAKSLQKSIEEIAANAGNEEVAQLNREIGDRLEAAKFLEELNGKTIKGGRLLKYVTTVLGSSAGQTIPGKIVGALGGNLIGELIIANNVANPIKRLLLANLEKTDPKAYTKTIQWLQKQNLDRETRLLLPAPAPLGSTKNPIITPHTTYEPAAKKIKRY